MATVSTSNLEQAREQTLDLVSALPDDAVERVHSRLMSPLVWDLGHIAAFEDLWLCHRGAGLDLLRPELMNVYDAFETPRADRGDLPYLDRERAYEYLRLVRERASASRYEDLVERHERQHNETMLQTLNLARIAREDAAEQPAAPAYTGIELIDVPGAEAFPLGATGDEFAYDNELPRHDVAVAAFRIARTPATNGDWLEFVEAGGYRRSELWSEAGWTWREQEAIEAPLNWIGANREWRLDGEREIDPQALVVHVSFHEAQAFARFHGLRLPTEPEWELAATWDGTRKLAWPWGDQPPTPQLANLRESRLFGTTRAGALGAGASPCGALAMIGDVWEWTSSEFTGYPGFEANPYREYSEVFFGGGYRVLRGGSFASSARATTPTFRNWDLPQRRQIFAGVRLAGDA